MSAQPQTDLFSDDGYPTGFMAWLSDNWGIWEAFERRALMAWRSGRKHYSARRIMEGVRCDTELRDKDITFKVNNNWTPGLARYFLEQHPECGKFFELRGKNVCL